MFAFAFSLTAIWDFANKGLYPFLENNMTLREVKNT
jgi:hypothetical protein